MRYLLLILSLVTVVRGETTQKKNCTASGEAIKVAVLYDYSFGYAMKWDPPVGSHECVHVYNVCVTVEGAPKTCQNTNATSWSTVSVQPCSNYLLSVEALGEGGQQLARGATAFISAPSELLNYTATNRTSTSLFMTWAVPTNNTCVQKYVLSWRNTTAEHDEASYTLKTTDTSYEITGLKPCTMYSVSIAGVTADNVETSQGLSIYTAAPGIPLAVSDMRVALVTASSISVQWEATSSCIEWYSVCVSAVGDTHKNCSQVSSNTLRWTSCAIMKPCTDYNVAVAAVDYAGQRSAEQVQVLMGGPGEAENLKVSNRTASSIVLTWGAPPDDGRKCLRNYELRVCIHGTTACRGTAVVAPGPSDDGSLAVGGLSNCEQYDIVLRSVATNNQSSPGVNVLVYTDPADKHHIVKDVATSMTYVGAAKVEASWTRPARRDCLGGYQVCFTDEDDGEGRPACGHLRSLRTTWRSGVVRYCSNYTLAVSPTSVDMTPYPAATVHIITPPYTVGNLTKKSVTESSIHMVWEQPAAATSGCLQGYAVHWCLPDTWGCNVNNKTMPGTMLGVDVTDYVITGLQRCVTYLVYVTAVGPHNTESDPGFIYVKSGGVPNNITRLSPLRTTCGSVFVEWSEPSGHSECVANYQVCWQSSSGGNKTCDEVDFLDTQHYITSLQPSTDYSVSVAAMGQGGEMSTAATIQASTQAPKKVEDLTLRSRTESSISVSWRSPSENAECTDAISIAWCYEDPHSSNSDSCKLTGNNSANITADSTGFNITDILPCSNYTITISVATAWGMASLGNTIRANTLYEKPVNVGEVHQRTNGSTVNMSWEGPSQTHTCIAGYHVCWSQDEPQATPVCGHTNTESFMLHTLPACEVYLASVRTITTDGSMSAAASVSLDLATPSEVSNMTVAKHSSDSLAVRWLPPLKNSECVKNYKVCLAGSLGVNATCETISNTETEHSITGLQPKTQYKITLITLGPEGKQSASSSIQAVTEEVGGGNAGSSLRYRWNSSSVACIAVLLMRSSLPALQ